MLDPDPRARRQGILDQSRRDPLAMIGIRDVIADLCRKAERRTTGTVGAQAAPACDLSVHFGHEDGMFVRAMFVEPCQPAFDADRLCISCGLLGRDGLVVNIHDGRKVIHFRESNYHLIQICGWDLGPLAAAVVDFAEPSSSLMQ